MRRFSPQLLAIILMSILYSGCSKQPVVPPEVVIDKTLPIVKINGHISEMKSIAFEWQSVSDPRVEGFYIYRSNPEEKTEKLHRIDAVESRYATHYVDNSLKPNTAYAYRFSSYDAKGVESVGSSTYRANTLPLIASVSFFRSIGNMPRSAKLIWRPHTDTQIKGYRIERKFKNEPKWEKIADIKGRLTAEYIDLGLEDNAVYEYRLFAITYSDIQSVPSEIVTVVTKPLPDPITNIRATQNLPKKILISWEASARENLSHYNIYRSHLENSNFSYHVKLTETSFNDIIESDGTVYFYKVTAVDTDGLESAQSQSAIKGMSLAKPKTPRAFNGHLRNHAVVLQWKQADSDTQSYTLIKTKKEGWLNSSVNEINNISETSFTDHEISPDVTYSYQVCSVNQYGVRSEPTEPITLSFEAK
jgi:hypothetical protein